MNDPHVVALNYAVTHGDTIDYGNAEPLDLDEPEFRLTVADRKVRFEFKTHHATEEGARDSLADYIRNWEFDATLTYGSPDSFRLQFEKAEIIDRNPTPGVTRIGGRLEIRGTGSARLAVGVSKYPSPPSNMSLNSDIETMHHRYMGFRARHEPLESMAYFCLTMLEDPPWGTKSGDVTPSDKRMVKRDKAARKFRIDKAVLDKIGHLSSTRGGQSARKREGTTRPLTASERHFLDRAVKAMIRRAAELECAPTGSLPMISLSDLPSLEGGPEPEDMATD